MPEAVLEKHRWAALADGLPDDAVRIVRKAEEIVDRLNHVVGMVSGKQELTSIEENLEVLRLSVSIESLVNMVIAMTKLYGGKSNEVEQLVTEFKNLIEEVQNAQKSGSFASTPKGTAEYIVTIVNILERVYNILYTSKAMWMREIGAERLPRKKIQEDVESCVRQYLDLLVIPAIELNTAISADVPKIDPEYLLEKFAYYVLVAPQVFIPKSSYAQVVAKLLGEKKYQPIRIALENYVNRRFTPYSYEAPQTTNIAYAISNAVEITRAETSIFWQSSIETYLDSLDLQLIFSRVMQYTHEEIELTLTSIKEQKNIDRFWQIFVNVALKSVGVHVEMSLEEEQASKKKSKGKSKQSVKSAEIEIPPDVERELEELFGGEFI